MVNRLGAALLLVASLNFLTNTTSTAAPQSSTDRILIAKKNKGSKWATSMNDAISRAQQEHKLVFVDIGAPWCGPCRFLEKSIFPDRKVQEFLDAGYVSTHIEADSAEGKRMLQSNGMRGIPALFVFDETGNLRGKMSGAPHDAASFIQLVQALTNGQQP